MVNRAVAALAALLLLASSVWAEDVHWQSVGWGGGGFYWSCVFDPHTDGTIYMGGDVAGVYKSTDHGQSWALSNRGLVASEVLSLAADPTTPGVVYAPTSNGICRSADSAATWTALPNTGESGLKLIPQKEKSVHAIAVDPSDSRRLYFGAPDGRILRSDDQGQSWTLLHTVDGGSVASVAARPKSPDVVFAATTDGLLMSVDAGKTFARQLQGNAMAIAFTADGKTAYAAMAGDGVARSDDGGRTWRPLKQGLDPAFQVIDVVVDAADPNKVYCIAVQGWGGLFYYSTDGGASWVKVTHLKADVANNPTGHDDQEPGNTVALSNPRNLAINPKRPSELMVAANWRPAHSDDGGRTWQESSKGADISCVMDVQFEAGTTYVAVMDEGLLASSDDGKTWRQLFPRRWSRDLSGHAWRVQAWNGGKEILALSSPWDAPALQAVHSLPDTDGKSFQFVREGLPTYVPTANTMWGRSYARALSSHPSNRFIVYMGMDGDPDDKGEGGGLFVSHDGGWHWKRSPGQPGSRRIFFGLAVDPTNPQRLFWGGCGVNGGLWRSEDAGATWKRVFSQDEWIFNVHVAPDGTVYCPGKQLWSSKDHGETWTQLTQLKDAGIVALESDPANPNRVWFAINTWDNRPNGAIYETTDGGKTWQQITGDIACNKPLVLRYNPSTHDLWAAGPCLFKTRR